MSFVISAVAVAVELGTAAAIATAVTQVGIAMSVVGAVTGSKDLMKVGGVLSLAGGIGGLAAGALGSTAAAAGETAAQTASMDAIGGEISASLAGGDLGAGMGYASATGGSVAASGLEAAGMGASQLSSSIPGAVDPFNAGFSGTPTTDVAAPLAGTDATTQAVAPGLSDVPALNAQATAPTVSGSASTAISQPGVAEGQMAGAYSDVAGEQFASSVPKPGMFEDVSKWYKTLTPEAQSRVSTAAMQMGGQALGGMFTGWSETQKLDLAKEIQSSKQGQINTQTANAAYAPRVAFKPIGLISGAQGAK